MRIGIPKEIKVQEHRVAATPAGVAELVGAGHEVWVQAGAGAAIGYADAAYQAAGARLADDAARIYAADLVFKVKEPQPTEVDLMRPGQTLFCYLHLAAAPQLARSLLGRGVTAIAFETVLDSQGRTPLLAPMSQIAGRMAVQAGMQALEMKHGGRGVLLPGVPGVAPGRVVILGGGMVGGNAARVAVGLGAHVTLLERDPDKLRHYDDLYAGRLETRYSTPANLRDCLGQADLAIGAVYVHGRRAPRLIDRDLLKRMPDGSALVDVSIDQGGIAETSRATTHDAPFYVEEGVVHYCVANMPGAVARTSTQALAEVTLPYLLKLAEHGARAVFEADAGFAEGLNLAAGRVTHAGLAADLGLTATAWRDALPWFPTDLLGYNPTSPAPPADPHRPFTGAKMSEPVVAQKSPYEVRLEPGEYWWCACGRSKTQPFCDGSHQGTEFQPVAFTVEEAGSYFMCGCKHTANPPFCDGAHELLD